MSGSSCKVTTTPPFSEAPHDSIVGHSPGLRRVRTYPFGTLTSLAQKCRCGAGNYREHAVGWVGTPRSIPKCHICPETTANSERDRCPEATVTGLPRPGQVVRHKYRGQSETEQPSYYTVVGRTVVGRTVSTFTR